MTWWEKSFWHLYIKQMIQEADKMQKPIGACSNHLDEEDMGMGCCKVVEGEIQVVEVEWYKVAGGGTQVAEHCSMAHATQDKQVVHTHGPLAAEAGNGSRQEEHDKEAAVMSHTKDEAEEMWLLAAL